MKFVDHAKAYVCAGRGGNGCISFRRKRLQPKGGPDGGDGGRGGNVVFVSDKQMVSLLDLSHRSRINAEDGQQGKKNKQSGKDGQDLIVRVPVGTLVIDATTGDVFQDLNKENKRLLAVRGGRGGRGNAKFATPSDRSPRRAEGGEKGEERWLRFELKLRADVGLIGLPNAGKSTLISKISSAKPRIADYPFTTTSPNLGVVRYEDFKSFVVADLPSLIQNAHQGRGLGTGFLKHVERTVLLVHVLDVTRLPNRGLFQDYETIMRELEAFNTGLREKPQIVAINKIDRLESPNLLNETERRFADIGIRSFPVSALTEQGVSSLVDEMVRQLEKPKSIVPERIQ